MNIRRWITGLSFAALCVAVVLTCVVRSYGNPCARLTRLEGKILRLSARPRPYRLSDRIVGLMHRSDPLLYYEREFAREKKGLLASGRLVEFRLPYTAEGPHSDREIAKALLVAWRRTGADYFIDFDRTNRLMLIACRPCDVRQFPMLK